MKQNAQQAIAGDASMSWAESALFLEHIPPHVRNLPPYVPGKPVEEAARETGIAQENIVKLASNENPLGVSARVRSAILDALDDITRYPDAAGWALRSRLAAKYGLALDQFILGNGSSEILDLATLAFLSPNTSAVMAQYSFSVYGSSTKARGASMIAVPARDYGHDIDAMLAAIRPDTRLVFFANPNNPTGTFHPGSAVKAFIERVPRNVVVVLDEAYGDYLPQPLRYDSLPWIAKHDNLLIVRTLSKAYGLAGLRIGFGMGSSALIGALARLRQPFNCNSLAQAAALAALDDAGYLEETRKTNEAGLKQLEEGFKKLGLAFVPSTGNFILLEVGDGAAVYKALLQKGIITRGVGPYGLARHVRISVGLHAENERLIQALHSLELPTTAN